MPICASRRRRSPSRATVSAAARPRSPCARASCWPTSPSSSCTAARRARRSPPTPTRSCRTTRCAAGSRTSRPAQPAPRCSARRCSPAARRLSSTSTAPGRRRPRCCAACRARRPSPCREGGRMALDMKALRAAAKANGPPAGGCWPRGRRDLEQVEARALIRDGVLVDGDGAGPLRRRGHRRLRARGSGRAHARSSRLP